MCCAVLLLMAEAWSSLGCGSKGHRQLPAWPTGCACGWWCPLSISLPIDFAPCSEHTRRLMSVQANAKFGSAAAGPDTGDLNVSWVSHSEALMSMHHVYYRVTLSGCEF